MAKAGDLVTISTKDKKEQGILMPSPDKSVVLIKLKSGYNLGFEKKDVQEIKLVQESKESKERKTKSPEPETRSEKIPKKNPDLKTVSILHCGGTIASNVDYETGAVKARFSPEELLEMFPELNDIVNLRSKLVANMLSENMRFAHYNLIAKEIEKEIKAGTDGIIITHGTDTLHYTAAALSFVLENINLPILLVGAQRSSDRGSSDAFLNLKCATQFIANSDFAGVATCLHHSSEDDSCAIILGVRSRKLHSSRRDAFKAVNSSPLAVISSFGKIKWLVETYSQRKNESKLILKLFNENLKVGLLKAHPQMFAKELSIYENFDGLILEGTGLGHCPIEKYDDKTSENESIFNEIEKLASKIPVVMTTQTIFGGVNMNVYSPGRKLVEAGVLGNGLDITTETAFIKLAWLLSNYEKSVTKDLFSKNFRGELSERRTYEIDFLK